MKLLKQFHRRGSLWLVGLFLLGLVLEGPQIIGSIGWAADAVEKASDLQPTILGLLGAAAEAVANALNRLPLHEKLGEAFLIAAVLAAIVDPLLKGKLLEEVSRDALSFAAGYVLPDPLKLLLRNIIKASYTRENFQISFLMSELPDHVGFVHVTMTTSYDVVNQIDIPVKCTIRSAIERGRWPDVGQSELMSYNISGCQPPISHDSAELRQLQIDDKKVPYIFHDEEVTLPPTGKGVVHVKTTRSIVYPNSWFYVLDLLDVTIGVDVELHNESEYDWHVDFGHDRKASESPGHRKYPGVFLPGNFARITWISKRPSHVPERISSRPVEPSIDLHWPTAADWIARAASADAVGTLGILGVPVCRGSITPGRCDLGPAAVRAALTKFSPYDFVTDRDLSDVGILDFADLDVAEKTIVEASATITEAVGDAIKEARVLVVLGGDNSVTRPAFRALSDDLSKCALLTIDAHLDLRDLDHGPSNGNPVRALLKDGLPGSHIVQIGIQSFANSAAYAEVAREAGLKVVPLEVVRARGMDSVVMESLQALGDVAEFIYVDFDVDALDRAFAPASPGSRPGGLLPAELLLAARLCGAHKKVVAIDIVEFDPSKDIADIGALTAASCFLSFAAGYRNRLAG